jgi:eukaryotic-like serine/threonine-protein kinase
MHAIDFIEQNFRMKTLYTLLLLSVVTFCFGQPPQRIFNADFTEKPFIKWKFKINQPILSSPIIDNDVVYFGGSDSTFYALKLSDSKVLWKFKTKGQIRSTVLVDGGSLYLNGGDGNLYKVDKKTGKTIWTYKTTGDKKYDFADYHQSSPVLFNNKIYFGAAYGLYVIDAEKGFKVWDYQTGDVVHSTPAIDNGKVFFGSFDGFVYALDASSGNLIWKFKTVGHHYFPKGEVQGSPTVKDGIVFIGARDYNIYALDQEKGFSRWNKAFPLGWVFTGTMNDSVLHLAGADERVLMSVDPKSGAELWKKKMEFLIFGKNVYSKSMLYVGTTIGKFHGIDAKTGEKKWTITTEGYEKNRLKYFKEDDSYRDDIYKIIKSSEHFLEVEYELGGIFSTAAIDKDHIVFASTEGVVYCLSRYKN